MIIQFGKLTPEQRIIELAKMLGPEKVAELTAAAPVDDNKEQA